MREAGASYASSAVIHFLTSHSEVTISWYVCEGGREGGLLRNEYFAFNCGGVNSNDAQ